MVESLIGTVIGAVIGGVISALVTWLFYRKSAEDLREESSQLRKQNDLALRGLEEAGSVEYTRDEEGNHAGLRVTRIVTGHIKPIRGEASAEMRESAPDEPEGE